jgi:hypothetical protein
VRESKRTVIAPEIPTEELILLRAYIDECYDPPDYTILVSYEVKWEEGFGSNFGVLDNFSAFKP